MAGKVIVRDLKKRYGSVQAVNGVNLEIEGSEIFGLLGPNGAGKTTTIECILGLRQPDDGDIEICGLDVRRRPLEVKQRIGAALQTTDLQDKITPREALGLFGSFYHVSETPETLLKRFSLLDKADAAFDSLSGGQRQRLALALAFVNRPEIVFLDEPTAGLDPSARREVHDDITRMKEEGRTVLFTTHYMDEAEALCDRVAIIDKGLILTIGTPQALIAQSSAMPQVSLETNKLVDSKLLSGLTGVQRLKCEEVNVRFQTEHVKKTLAELLDLLATNDVDIISLHVRKATLEDVFIELTGNKYHDDADARTAPSSTHAE